MVHSMTPKAGMLCMLAAWICRVPRRVHTFTGLVWPTATGIKRRILMVTDWLTCACATHVIPEGKGVMDDLQRHITRKPMKVLGYGNVRGVDMEAFSRRSEVMTEAAKLRRDDLFTFIFVGRIVGDKGINELVQAFIRLQKVKPNVRLLLVGNYEANLDPVKPETKELIDTTPSIEAVGPQYGDDLKAYYAASDCFVFPSYREGFPNTVMEAGAMDLPSIVTDINGSREIINNGENGIIIPSKDAEALYSAMLRMATDTPTTQRMARSARPLIASRFEQGFVRDCLYDFYKGISE
jgi:glycosyltransferase involved in cell wall biosynthesis